MLLGNLLPFKLKKRRWFRASLVEWNKAAMLKHIWVLAAKSPYIDYRYFTYNASFFYKHFVGVFNHKPNNGSWIFRKLLQVRELAIRYIIHDVGNGTNTSLWYDSLLPIGSIVERYVW